MNQCSKCRFWSPIEDGGQCRRRAPVINTSAVKRYDAVDDSMPLVGELEPAAPWWPETNSRAWCGEFETK